MNSTTQSSRSGGPETNGRDTTDHLRAAARHAEELKRYATFWIQTKLNGIQQSARNLVVLAVLGVLGLIAGIAMISVLVSMLLRGLTGAVSAIPGIADWAAALIVSGLLLGGIAGGLYLALRRMNRSAARRLRENYERQLEVQRIELGQDVHQRAGQAIP